MTVWQKIDRERAAALEVWAEEIQRWASFFDTTQERCTPKDVKGPPPED